MTINQDGVGQWVGAAPVQRSAAISEYWAVPDPPHAYDVEFDSPILPAGFTLWNIQAPSTATAVSPSSGIDYLTQPSAGNARVEANLPGRRSWCCFQPRGENIRWLYSKPVLLDGSLGWIVRTRLATHIRYQSGSNNASTMRFILCKDLLGKPQISAAGASVQSGLTCGWESDGNTMQLEFGWVGAGVYTMLVTGPDVDLVAAEEFELDYVLRPGAAGVTWDIFYKSGTLTTYIGGVVATGLNIGQGDTVHVGWDFLGIDANMPSAPILSTDYARFRPGATGYIP